MAKDKIRQKSRILFDQPSKKDKYTLRERQMLGIPNKSKGKYRSANREKPSGKNKYTNIERLEFGIPSKKNKYTKKERKKLKLPPMHKGKKRHYKKGIIDWLFDL